MSDNQKIQNVSQSQDKIDQWFNNFIDQIKADHLLVATNTAPAELAQMYNAFIHADKEAMYNMAVDLRKIGTQQLIKTLVVEYFKELGKQPKMPNQLALGLSDSKIFVWAEIEDNDVTTEDSLLLSEAAINEKFYKHGLYISSTIVEISDKLPIPPHYQPVHWQTSKTT